MCGCMDINSMGEGTASIQSKCDVHTITCETCVCCNVLQCVVVCCSVLQCVAVCCSVLQCVITCETSDDRGYSGI